jgi:hypothetical protein
VKRTKRDSCPAWCRGHTAVESDELAHETAGVTVETDVPQRPGTARASVWAQAIPGSPVRIVISRCVPPPDLPWRVDLEIHQAWQLAGLADTFAPGLAEALRRTASAVQRDCRAGS